MDTSLSGCVTKSSARMCSKTIKKDRIASTNTCCCVLTQRMHTEIAFQMMHDLTVSRLIPNIPIVGTSHHAQMLGTPWKCGTTFQRVCNARCALSSGIGLQEILASMTQITLITSRLRSQAQDGMTPSPGTSLPLSRGVLTRCAKNPFLQRSSGIVQTLRLTLEVVVAEVRIVVAKRLFQLRHQHQCPSRSQSQNQALEALHQLVEPRVARGPARGNQTSQHSREIINFALAVSAGLVVSYAQEVVQLVLDRSVLQRHAVVGSTLSKTTHGQ